MLSDFRNLFYNFYICHSEIFHATACENITEIFFLGIRIRKLSDINNQFFFFFYQCHKQLQHVIANEINRGVNFLFNTKKPRN